MELSSDITTTKKIVVLVIQVCAMVVAGRHNTEYQAHGRFLIYPGVVCLMSDQLNTKSCMLLVCLTNSQDQGSYGLIVGALKWSLYPFLRPDRDDYINVDTSELEAKGYHSAAKQYRVMAPESWLNTNHPYELDSVMHYGSYSSKMSYPPVMELKDGGRFGPGKRMTTTDSLQVDEMYCKDFPQYRLKTGFKSD